MSAFFNHEKPNQSQADMMEQYMQFCMFQKHQEQHKNTFDQFMKSQQQFQVDSTQSNENENKKEENNEEPLYERFMKEMKTSSISQQSFIPFDIDNFNGDGLQKAFDLAYQTESKRLSCAQQGAAPSI